MQLQVGNDLRVEQADGVGRHRIAKAGMELLRDRGAAHHLAPLDHLHAQPGHREVGRAGEAVVPGADDDNVCFGHGLLQEMAAASRAIDRCGYRHSGMVRRKDQTRNLEIPGSREDARPGTTL